MRALFDAFAVEIRRGRDIDARTVKPRDDVGKHSARQGVVFGVELTVVPFAANRVALVIARPDDQAGVVAEAADLVFRFAPEVRFELLRFGIDGARHHEILPNGDAVLVAEIVKRVFFVYAAAPDADGVAVQVFEQVERDRKPLRTARKHRVRGDVVRAEAEHFVAVYLKAELAASLRVRYGCAVERRGADAGFQRLRFDGFAAADELDLHVVKVGLAHALRRPEHRVWDVDIDSACAGGRGSAEGAPAADAGDDDFATLFGLVFDADDRLAPNDLFRVKIHALYQLGRFIHERNAFENRAAHKPRKDVPAVCERRLAEGHGAVAVIRHAVFPRGGGGVLEHRRGQDMHKQLVDALADAFGGEIVRNERVIRFAELHAVEEDFGDGVNAVEAQRRNAIRGRVVEAARVPQVLALVRLRFQHVIADEKLRQHAEALERRFQRFRYKCVKRRYGGKLRFFPDIERRVAHIEAPFAVKVDNSHKYLLGIQKRRTNECPPPFFILPSCRDTPSERRSGGRIRCRAPSAWRWRPRRRSRRGRR